MKDLLRIASLLDNSGQYKLSDKLFKIAQEKPSQKATISDIYDTLNSNTVQEFANNLKKFATIYNFIDLKTAMDQYANAGATLAGKPINQNFILKKFYIQFGTMNVSELDTYVDNLYEDYNRAQENQKLNSEDNRENVENFGSNDDAQWEADKGTYQRFKLMNSNTPENFVESLFLFANQNNIKNLVQAFDAYANAGASYNGNLINRDPILKELYMRVRNTQRIIQKDELVNEIKMLSNPQGTMNNQAASMRSKMPAGQAYENFTQAINNSKSLQELERYIREISNYDINKFDQNDKNALFSLIKEKETEITSNNQQETADNYNEFISLVQQEPLAGLETLRTEIQNNQYLTEQQKTQLNIMIDTRITNRR